MNLKLTKKAIEEKDKLTAREISSINFSKMAVGSGLYTSEELANEITELSTVEITTEIVNVYQEMVDIKTDVPKIAEETVKKESQLFITSTFFNKDVEEKFEVREVGIYAISNEDKQEYLYAYYIVASTDTAIAIVQDKSLPQYMPISVNTKLSNIDEVNIAVVNDMLVVNQDEFKRYKVDIKKHIDDEDISIRTYVDTEDRKIKTYIDEQDTTIRNTKSDLSHGHNLADENIDGILPISKGGTGNNQCRVSSLNEHHNGNYGMAESLFSLALGDNSRSTSTYSRNYNRLYRLTTNATTGAKSYSNDIQVYKATTSDNASISNQLRSVYHYSRSNYILGSSSSNGLGQSYTMPLHNFQTKPDYSNRTVRSPHTNYTASRAGILIASLAFNGGVGQILINGTVIIQSHSNGGGGTWFWLPVRQGDRYQFVNAYEGWFVTDI